MMIAGNYIGGHWQLSCSSKTREIIDPAVNRKIATVTDSDVRDVELAIESAKRSFYIDRTWRDMDSQSRADILLEIANLIEKKQTELAKLETVNNGKPLREAIADVDDVVHCFRYYAGIIKMPYGGVYDVNENFGRMHSYTIHEPVGVCALIVPWNFPLVTAAWKIAPAIAAGNSVIFKPSEETPLTAIELFKIFDEIKIPAGTVNLVLGDGQQVGKFLAAALDIELISFTGSTAVGREITKASATNLKRVCLELGWKSPNIIFSDADIDGAVEWAMIGIFFNQGEVCAAGSRIIVAASIKDLFLEKLIEKTKKLTIGPGSSNADMGPLISLKHLNKVLSYIKIGVEEGGKLVYGGQRYEKNDGGSGFFMEPTIFAECHKDMRIVREEIFGPVLTVQTFETEEEAVFLANDTDYGLAGAVFTADGAKALRVIKEIRAGITWINAYNPTFNEAPWGGYKQSGNGRELGIHGLEEYQEIKQININLRPGPVHWYK